MKCILEKKERKINKLIECVKRSEENQKGLMKIINSLTKEVKYLRMEKIKNGFSIRFIIFDRFICHA